MKNFKELKIWQKGFEIAVDSYTIIIAKAVHSNADQITVNNTLSKLYEE